MDPTTPTKTLDLSAEFSRIKGHYDATGNKFSAMILGFYGSGKTVSLATAPGPVLLHSFDPGGTKSLREAIASGHVIPDTRFEVESFESPTALRLWEEEMKHLERNHVFEKLGTYVIDSSTFFSEAILNAVCKKNPTSKTTRSINPFGIPQMEITDWGTFAKYFTDAIKRCIALPCNFILTGHLQLEKDEVSGAMLAMVALPGRTKEVLPLLFDEIYIAQAVQTSSGTNYRFLTQPEGRFHARTRLGGNGRLARYEDQNFTTILSKCGIAPTSPPPGAIQK